MLAYGVQCQSYFNTLEPTAEDDFGFIYATFASVLETDWGLNVTQPKGIYKSMMRRNMKQNRLAKELKQTIRKQTLARERDGFLLNLERFEENLGLLERLAKDMPLDVIFEIFCYVSPGDLLQLARSSKDLRAMLMSKSSESIWRIARESVRDLPPRPEDLNEPQYAHLLYDPYCHVCNQTRCDDVLSLFRMRCCTNCIWSTFTLFNSELRESLPAQFRYRQDLLPALYSRQNLKRFQQGIAHGRSCQRWLEERLASRTRVLDDIRKQRKEAILNRLDEIGWRKEAKIIMSSWKIYLARDEFSDHKLVKQAKKLTEYGWNSIKTDLVKKLSDCKAKRLAVKASQNPVIYQRYSDLREEYSAVLSESDIREPFPAIGDIISHKLFSDLIWDTPHDEYLGDDFFRLKLSEYLPGIIDEWRPAKIQELLEVMRQSHSAAITSDLHLATSIFECSNCWGRGDLRYPQVFYHSCCHAQVPDGHRDERFEPYVSTFPYGMRPWTSRTLTINETESQASRVIIQSFSLDPTTTTIQDIYSANPLIECMSCASNQGRMFTRWPLLPKEHQHHTLRINSLGEETSRILAFEPDCTYAELPYVDVLCCAHCNKSLAIMKLLNHLEDVHRIYINVDKKVSRSSNIEAAQEHWYWNPRWSCVYHSLRDSFRYKEVKDGETRVRRGVLEVQRLDVAIEAITKAVQEMAKASGV
ncbi:hypothetical protein BT96DRAFT_977791 [Gymnopus androsaceus JB14]|uniref:F-box domain-containing protein n=1 Tax=Gymnopus androsaceus JB14 TaxID=1447944 RepID=A0A6A4HFK5_9AGAR|nr:hypothetical protein BT96DRAFT_977791 [Gymnopus androsaceus JB14]